MPNTEYQISDAELGRLLLDLKRVTERLKDTGYYEVAMDAVSVKHPHGVL